MKAERMLDGQIRLYGKVWSDVFPESKRLGWLEFYKKRAEDLGRAEDQETVDALSSV
jgi:hypothetical protein